MNISIINRSIIGIILLLLIANIAYAAMDVGGSMGIDISVSENATDGVNATIGDDIPQDNPDVRADIYYKGYAAFDSKQIRDEKFAFSGEEIIYEVYVTEPDKVKQVSLDFDREVVCEKRQPSISSGDLIGEGFSENVRYEKGDMAYYVCNSIVDSESLGTMKITAYDENYDRIGSERDGFVLNPDLTMSFSDSMGSSRMISMIDFWINVAGCGNNDKIEPYMDKVMQIYSCSADNFLIARII